MKIKKMMNINSKEIWENIYKDKNQSGWLAQLVQLKLNQNVYLAYKSPEMIKTILVEATSTLVSDIKEFKAKGFKIFFEGVSNYPNKTRLCIQLLDNDFEEIFFEITDLLLESIKEVETEDVLIKKVLERILIYQAFFEKPKNTGFRINAQQGLFTELDFMEKKLFHKIGIDKCLNIWKAPDSGLHDFTGFGNSLEMKSTNTIPAQNIGVTSEFQLNDKRVSSLYLCVTEINRNVTNGENLSQKIDKISSIIKDKEPDQSEKFDLLIAKYGYFNLHSPDYLTKFSVNLRFYYKIEGQFPRIVPTELSEGVKRVGYQIDLNQCEEWKIDETEAINNLTDDLSK